eukprot:INCI13415.4.p1 GENE.INCI13415.4~~INCI13415.4.p1  ORF type:complete len:216 (+),score=42.00 INCI13415.4:340-987(+)
MAECRLNTANCNASDPASGSEEGEDLIGMEDTKEEQEAAAEEEAEKAEAEAQDARKAFTFVEETQPNTEERVGGANTSGDSNMSTQSGRNADGKSFRNDGSIIDSAAELPRWVMNSACASLGGFPTIAGSEEGCRYFSPDFQAARWVEPRNAFQVQIMAQYAAGPACGTMSLVCWVHDEPCVMWGEESGIRKVTGWAIDPSGDELGRLQRKVYCV